MGGIAAHYLTGASALAQNTPAKPPYELRAQTFTLVDLNNQPAGTLSVEGTVGPGTQNRTRIVLRDPQGGVIWSAGGSPLRPLSER
jgi:hypothetical protein